MRSEQRSARIRELNDGLRTTFIGGLVHITQGVNHLPPYTGMKAIGAVKAFGAFTAENDPYGEHDFGNFEVEGEKFFWKIDYYGKSLDEGSKDPADPEQTTRVLTIMLVSEY